MTASAAIFYVLASVALLAAVAVILSRHPVHSAIYLVLSFLGVAGVYVLLQAEFVAAVQVLVYAGGIMVLFLFVIMLVNLGDTGSRRVRLHATLSGTIGLAALGLLLYATARARLGPGAAGEALRAGGNLQAVGQMLYRDFVLPFEIASVLLLVAMVGAIVLARHRT